jgi:hypothetical protein
VENPVNEQGGENEGE